MADWYYARNGQQAGPVQFAELQALAARGQLAASDLVWTEGLTQWQAAWQVQELMPSAFAPSPGTQPGYASAPAQAYAYPQTMPYQTPFAPPSQHAGLALTGMILSLVSLAFGGPFLSIPGAICGWVALKGMRRTGDYRNKGFALAGIWIGVIETALLVVILAIVLVAVVAANH